MKRGESVGRFAVLAKLGEGAHSSVLHVRRQADGKQYALKVVPVGEPDDQKFVEQARTEYDIAGRLDSPHVVKVFALEQQRDWLFRVRKVQLLVEFINGKTLDTTPVLPVNRLVQVFCRVASALAHMHRRGVLHGDMKPGNLMLSRAGDVKVIDLGLARVKGEERDRVQGTPEYMAPETAKHKHVTEQSDLYNFGATMYRLLTFRLPPSAVAPDGGPMSGKLARSLLKPVRELNPQCPEALDALVCRCLSWKAQDRPARAAEVVSELEQLVEQLVTSSGDKLEALQW